MISVLFLFFIVQSFCFLYFCCCCCFVSYFVPLNVVHCAHSFFRWCRSISCPWQLLMLLLFRLCTMPFIHSQLIKVKTVGLLCACGVDANNTAIHVNFSRIKKTLHFLFDENNNNFHSYCLLIYDDDTATMLKINHVFN